MCSQFSHALALARFQLSGDPVTERIEDPDAAGRPEPLLTIQQFAERPDVSVRTLNRRIADKTVRVLKLGRLVRIPPSELSRLLGEPANNRDNDSIVNIYEQVMRIPLK